MWSRGHRTESSRYGRVYRLTTCHPYTDATLPALGSTVSEIDLASLGPLRLATHSKTLFSMFTPEVKTILDTRPNITSIVLFGIEVSTLYYGYGLASSSSWVRFWPTIIMHDGSDLSRLLDLPYLGRCAFKPCDQRPAVCILFIWLNTCFCINTAAPDLGLSYDDFSDADPTDSLRDMYTTIVFRQLYCWCPWYYSLLSLAFPYIYIWFSFLYDVITTAPKA